jgi:diacylglycerol kinase family enzyme
VQVRAGVLHPGPRGTALRALLVFNPNATTTDDRVRDVIESALSSAVDLDVQATKQRGHATHIVAGAVHEGVDAVFALGGDGTANEVLQALAGTDILLGLIPGGGANVLARALGLPNDAVAATSVLLEHLRAGRSRTITLGRAAGRYFGFNAGFGFDAAVVRHVEQHDQVKKALRQLAFVWSTVAEWSTGEGREVPAMSLQTADGTGTGPFQIAIVANADPYTYLGSQAMHVHPRASFDEGLDLVTIAKVSTPTLLGIVARVFRDGSHVRSKHVTYHHDLDRFTLTSPHPLPLMVDGDYAGEHTAVTFEAVRDALRVLA